MSFLAPNVTALWSSLAPYRFVILSASAFILLFVFANSYRKRLSSQRLPFATLEGQDPLESWFKDGNKLIEEGLRRYAGPFQIQTGTGAKVIVRNCNTEAFAKSPAMSVAEALRLDSFADYPGFEAARVSVHSSVIRDTLLRRLTPALDILRPNLVKDAVNSIAHNFGDHDTWATVPIQPLILDIVTKVSSRPFVGDYLCEDPKWLEIQKQYAGLSFTAASELRKCTALFRPIKHWFLPSCVVLRQLVQDARVLVASELKRRGQSEKVCVLLMQRKNVRLICVQGEQRCDLVASTRGSYLEGESRRRGSTVAAIDGSYPNYFTYSLPCMFNASQSAGEIFAC